MYLENHVARQRGLLGMWAAEDVIGADYPSDRSTRGGTQNRQSFHGWNDQQRELKLVFEFKRLGRQRKHRDQYLG